MSKMEPIAIVGMAGRFPGAPNLDAFWRNLRDGAESMRRFTPEELAREGVDPALIADPAYVPVRAMLDDADLFDAAFFGINPREAQVIDPQHRLFLEVAWEALENAACDPDRTPEGAAVGVFAGTTMSTYVLANLLANPEFLRTVGTYQTMLGNDKDYIATRLSYKLNLRGPSVVVQTACSTSLVAVQMACQALLARQCDIALTGGVSVGFPQHRGYVYQSGMILSPTGQCRAFDAEAHGTVAGEGVGVVVLKRLHDALEQGDPIRAIIRGAAINNDGARKVGYTAPGIDGQTEVITRAQALGGVAPETVSYVEAHGTGTELGDPIEVAALTRAFRAGTDRTQFCAIGSVKTNIGHLDAAAGIAGLIKTVLALENATIPASLHFERPNPQIDFASSPFFVNAATRPWPDGDTPRRAGVSSFGIGGTNAHVVVEEAPNAVSRPPEVTPQLIVLSARTPASLANARARLATHLRVTPGVRLDDVSCTLQQGRKRFAHRLAAVVHSTADAADALDAAPSDARGARVVTSAVPASERGVAFLFPGQGAQHANMARGLYDTDPLFRATVDSCATAIIDPLGVDIRTALFPEPQKVESADAMLQQTRLAQPALFIVEYALAQLWLRAGVHPEAMLGHSIGEYVAACLAGVLSLDAALALVVERGRAMDIAGGAMLAAPLSREHLEALLPEGVDIAAVNGPQLTVASGPADGIARLEQRLAAAGTPGRRLHTAHAFHSRMMEPALAPFALAFARVQLSPPRIPFVSNVTGTWITDEQATDPSYWVRHLRSPVMFSAGITALAEESDRMLLEVGPGTTLATLARQHHGVGPVASTMRHPRESIGDREAFLTAVGRAWVAGVDVEWNGIESVDDRRRVALPAYPFERQRFWVEPHASRLVPDDGAARRKNPRIDKWFNVPSWRAAPAPPAPRSTARAAWLVLTDSGGAGKRIAAELRARGDQVALATPGLAFAARDDQYVIRPGNDEDATALLGDLERRGMAPDRVLHCWTLTSHDAARETPSRSELRSDGAYALVTMARALAARGSPSRTQITVLTDRLERVAEERVVCPERAAVCGASIAISQEYLRIACRCLDLGDVPNGPNAEPAVATIVDELERDVIPFVALRGRLRYERTFVPYPLAHADGAPALLRERGVYAITGGFSGVGLTLARHLAHTVRARLALFTRRPLPAREEWDGIVRRASESASDADDIARRVSAVHDLEAAGAEVLVVTADLTDTSQVATGLAAVHARWGAVHGVIHAAGDVLTVEIDDCDPDSWRATYAAKADGARVLLDALRDIEAPDFVVLCSSIASTLGGLGRAPYAASNAVLDAMARAEWQPGDRPRVRAIGWDAWRDVGSITRGAAPRPGTNLAEFLENAIRPVEGAEAFARALVALQPELIVSARVLPFVDIVRTAQSYGDGWSGSDGDATDGDATDGTPAAVYERPEVSSEFVAPVTDVERRIAVLWQQLLGIERVGLHDDFFELGGHSLLATQLIARLHDAFGVRVPLRTLFDASTVSAMASHIELLQWSRNPGAGEPDDDAGREEIEI